MRYIATIIIGAALLASPAFAQIDEPVDKEREAAELRVEDQMVRMNTLAEALAKNLGQLHYLRTLCFGDQDQTWRDYAGQMMTMETGADSSRRRTLIRAFNAGYYHEKDRFDACSQAVSVDVAAIAENARHLAGMLGDPYR